MEIASAGKRAAWLLRYDVENQQIHRESSRLVDISVMPYLLQLDPQNIVCLSVQSFPTHRANCCPVLAHLLLLDLGFHHLVLRRGRFLVGDELLGVCQPAQQRLQGILKLPAVQQGLLQLSNSLGHLHPKHNPVAWSGW